MEKDKNWRESENLFINVKRQDMVFENVVPWNFLKEIDLKNVVIKLVFQNYSLFN